MSYRIPLSSPDITEAEIAAVTAVLRTNTLSLGRKLDEFEQVFASFHNMPFAVAVSSGTAALHLALLALNVGQDDEVIVPSFTFIAVANAVRYVGATPVFADIDADTLNLDANSVSAAITPRTKAVIVVHTFGVPADMDALLSVTRHHHLAVIEDACEAIGAAYKEQFVGTFADISTFAFYPNKQLTTGEGGMLLTRDAGIADRLRALRNQGRYATDDWLQHSELGYNYRLSELACALGVEQVRRLPSMLAARDEVAATYDRLLCGMPNVQRPPLSLPNCRISWFVYVIRFDATCTSADRDQLMAALKRQGIASGRYFAPIHLQPAYADLPGVPTARLDVTEMVAQRTVALPFFNKLSPKQAAEVTNAIAGALGYGA